MNSTSATEAVLCPACFAKNTQTRCELTSAQAAQHFVLRETDPERFARLADHIKHLWKQENCQIRECECCRFCFSHPFVSGDEQFYTLAYKRSGYPTWKWEFEVTYEALSVSARSDQRLLELGAGNGAFVKRVTDVIPKVNIVCTEYSEYGIGKIRELGVKCLAEDVRNLTPSDLDAPFDYICMFQVLEHMDHLDELFNHLGQLLTSGGSLFIAVPNAIRTRFNELNGALLDMPPNHIGRWNRQSFEVIGTRHGLNVKDYKLEPLSFASRFKQFPTYRFLRKSQRSGSLENRICRITNPKVRRALQALAVGGNLVLALPSIARMTREMGSAQWVHLLKDR